MEWYFERLTVLLKAYLKRYCCDISVLQFRGNASLTLWLLCIFTLALKWGCTFPHYFLGTRIKACYSNKLNKLYRLGRFFYIING